MQALALSHFTVTTAAGCGNQANVQALQAAQTGLRQNDFLDVALETWIGRVAAVEAQRLPRALAHYQCRNHQLAWLALHQDQFDQAVIRARQQYGAEHIGVFLGTSSSGILTTELAYQTLQQNTWSAPPLHFYQQHNHFALADFVRTYFHLQGPAHVVSTACSSSAKVFAVAARYLELGLCQAAIVGGVDSLCLTTLYGFNALELVAQDVCRPADAQRQGLSIGEGAAFALLEPRASARASAAVYCVGYGESSDAYHMSSPQPDGLGARLAMTQALQRADLTPAQIDYINLHGTATPANDRAEDCAVNAVLPDTPCSSTKGWTGHTLGAAGAVEAVYSALALIHGFMPVSLHTQTLDPAFHSPIVLSPQKKSLQYVMSNSFGFGGSNACLVFGGQAC